MTQCGLDNCNKTLRPVDTTMTCRCGIKFCRYHRTPYDHNCTFDYKKHAQNQLSKKIEIDLEYDKKLQRI